MLSVFNNCIKSNQHIQQQSDSSIWDKKTNRLYIAWPSEKPRKVNAGTQYTHQACTSHFLWVLPQEAKSSSQSNKLVPVRQMQFAKELFSCYFHFSVNIRYHDFPTLSGVWHTKFPSFISIFTDRDMNTD